MEYTCIMTTWDAGTDIAAAGQVLTRFGHPEAEQQVPERITNPEALSEHIAARLCLLRALCVPPGTREVRKICDLTLMPFTNGSVLGYLKKTESGKPFFQMPGAPVFSLSHTERAAVCVLCPHGAVGIGVDLERADRTVLYPEAMAERWFTVGEQALFRADGKSTDAFLRIWMRKEALGKALGKGLDCITALDTAGLAFDEWCETAENAAYLVTVYSA